MHSGRQHYIQQRSVCVDLSVLQFFQSNGIEWYWCSCEVRATSDERYLNNLAAEISNSLLVCRARPGIPVQRTLVIDQEGTQPNDVAFSV